MALLFGSTWPVNSAVFFTGLILILLANLYVLKVKRVRLLRYYLGLLIFLTAGVLVLLDLFLSGRVLWRYAAPCILALGPMFFAGVIFAESFRDARNPIWRLAPTSPVRCWAALPSLFQCSLASSIYYY